MKDDIDQRNRDTSQVNDVECGPSHPRKVICILGMHRSGTSAVARAVNLLGADLGPQEQLLPAKQDNPTGFWENAHIVDFHSKLLDTLGWTWDQIHPLPARWWLDAKVMPYAEWLTAIIQEDFAGKPLWMFKDPRTCLLLPLWKEVLAKLGYELICVICLRNPLDVVASLETRDGFSKTKSLALWQLHTLSALKYSSDLCRCLVSYELFVDHPVRVVQQIARDCGLTAPESVDQIGGRLRTFVDKSLCHSASDMQALMQDSDVFAPVKSIYHLLRKAEQSTALLQSEDFTATIEERYLEYGDYAQIVDGGMPAATAVRMQVYWAEDQVFSEANSQGRDIVDDGKPHEYRLTIPAGVKLPIRLDPVNFPAYVEIQSIALFYVEANLSPSSPAYIWSQDDGYAGVRAVAGVVRLDDSQQYALMSLTHDAQLLLETPGFCIQPPSETTATVIRVTMRVEREFATRVAKLTQFEASLSRQEAMAASLCGVLEQHQNMLHDAQLLLKQLNELCIKQTQADDALKIRMDCYENIISETTTHLDAVTHKLGTLFQAVDEQKILNTQFLQMFSSVEEAARVNTGRVMELAQSVRYSSERLADLERTIQEVTLGTNRLASTLEERWRAEKAKVGVAKRASQLLTRLVRSLRVRVHHMRIEPLHEVQVVDGVYESTGIDPQLRLLSSRKTLPTRWVSISYRLGSEGPPLSLCLYVDDGSGFSEEHKFLLPTHISRRQRCFFRFPDWICAVRLDPMSRPGRFHIEDIRITEWGEFIIAGTLVAHRLREVILHPRELFGFSMRAIQRVKSGGFQAIKLWLTNQAQAQSTYDTWVEAYDTLTDHDRRAIRAHIEQMARKPLISVIMPVYNTPAQWLSRALDSVLSQLYPYWELCVVDDASSVTHVRKILDAYQKKDARIRVIYRSKNGHISEASNDGIAAARGAFLALLDHDDELSEHALYMVVSELNTQPNLDIIYSDEDKIDENQVRYDPYFKPDWNPDLFFTQNCISHLGVYRTSMVRAVEGFRKGYEGAQDWDLALRIIERSSADKIRHIPRILYHWRSIPGSTARSISEKNYAGTAQEKMLKDYFTRQRVNAQVIPVLNGNHWHVQYETPSPMPLVSLIIPTRDGYEVLHRCMETIFEKTTYPNFEVIIVDNQSTDPKTLAYFDTLKRERGVRLLPFDEPFNFSAINNFAAGKAKGELLGFLNNDLEIISPGWLDEMVQNAIRPEIGAVGALLYFPNNTIQHAGIILGVGASRIAGHAYYQMPCGFHGQMGRAQLTQNLSAVTAACLVVQRLKFEEVSGFEEELAIAFNDVDFCLRLRKQGYRNIWVPYATLYHHESASRGSEHTPEKQKRFERECAYMEKAWGQILHHDPAYNPNLSVDDTFALAFPPRVANPWIQAPVEAVSR